MGFPGLTSTLAGFKRNPRDDMAFEGQPRKSTERLLSIREVRETLGVSSQTLYRLIRRGELPAVKIGARTLVREGELDAFVRGLERRRAGDPA
jgi:excisionase family DNA binding protein